MISPRTAGFWGALAAAGAAAPFAGAPVVAELAAAAGAGLGLANLLVDPHRRFHAPRIGRPYYSRPRHLNPGLARTATYDTALMGNSLIENLRPAEVEAALGGRCLKLPMPTAAAREVSLLLDVVVRAGRARRVILCLDAFTFRGAPDRFGHGPDAFPVHLYRPGLAGSLRYALSVDTFATSWRVIRRSLSRRPRRQFDPEAYGDDPGERVFSEAAVRACFAGGAPDRGNRPEEFEFSNLERNWRGQILPHFDAGPRVDFLLYLPPWSVLAWADAERKGILESCLAFRTLALETAAARPNARLFDFQADDVVSELDEYRDLIHYSAAVNGQILARLAAGEPVATAESIRRGDERIREWIRRERSPAPPPSPRTGR